MSFEKRVNTCDGARKVMSGGFEEDASLSVRLTALCDNACSFCIAEEDMKTRHDFDLEAVVKRTLESKASTVSILGGEPLLFLERCKAFLTAVRPHVAEVYITTSLPKTLVSQWDLFLEVAALTDYFTVSLQSLDSAINNSLLNAKNDFDRIELLERMLSLPDLQEKITVNLNLVKGGVDTKGKLMGSVFMLESFGCRKLRINEVMHAPREYVNFEKMMGWDMESPYAHGCKTEVPLSSSMTVVVKRSCFMVEGSLLATDEDVEKVEDKISHPESYEVPGWRVLYEHGEYDLKWRKGRKLLPLFVK